MNKAIAIDPYFEEIGEGCLYLGGDGQGTDVLSKECPVARAQAPGARSGFDTAYLSNIDGTDFFQWTGRRADGYFHPWGKILRITPAGIKRLEKARDEAEDYQVRTLEALIKRVKRHRTRTR